MKIFSHSRVPVPTKYKLVVGALVVLLFLLLSWRLGRLVPPQQFFRDCFGSMTSIGDALLQYQAKHHALPAAYVPGADGRPAHSWRIAILPFLQVGNPEIESKYRYDEPWNGPHNATLHDKGLWWYYHCPSDPGTRSETSYVAVVGPRTAFPGWKGVRLTDIKWGAANTIVVVETMQSGIHWMEPRDMSINDALRGVNAKPEPSISSRHYEQGGAASPGAHVALTDGSARWLSVDTDPKVLRQMLEIKVDEPPRK
jgi:hypothetical protein